MRAVLLALSGCAAREKPVAAFGAGTCDAKPAVALIGRIADDALLTEAKRSSRSKTARVIAPGTMATMDYRTDRLNLTVDADRRVVGVGCG